VIEADGKNLGYPADTIAWMFDAATPPTLKNIYAGKPKFLLAPSIDGSVFKFLATTPFPWTVQKYPAIGKEIEV
jgi:hypothetical protein